MDKEVADGPEVSARGPGVTGASYFPLPGLAAARDIIRSGTPETVVMAVTGHSIRAMLDRYNITSERDTREAMARLSERRTVTAE